MAVIPKGQRVCWNCEGTGIKVIWLHGQKVETTCQPCGGTGEK
jgi:DnaJ-class molecular chaperone